MVLNSPHLLAFGAAHMDRIAQLQSAPRPASVPADVKTFAGGAAFNATRQYVRAGGTATLWTPGDVAAMRPAAAGVTLHQLEHGANAAPSYTAILDPHGELVVAASDMRRYDELRSITVTLEQATHVLIDANLSDRALQTIARNTNARAALYAMAVSPAKIERLRNLPRRIDVLFANRQELKAVGSSPDAVLAFCDAVVMSDGPNALIHLDRDGTTSHRIDSVQPVDVTGAGDAVTGAYLCAIRCGATVPEALRSGAEAAKATIMDHGPFPF